MKNIFRRKKKDSRRNKYLDYYRNLPIDEKAVFLEARNGKEIDGNIYYIVRELFESQDYSDYRLFVSAEEDKKEIIAAKLETISADIFSRVEIVTVDSLRYYEIAASAGFIICDATLKNFFIKKAGQVYLNVWHGTPFKVMGRKVIHEPHATGNAQKNFTIADYLLYPNEYMMEHMIEDYMIANTSDATILLGGYPRNTAFFDDEKRKEIIGEQKLDGKRIYVYMPTHRPTLMGETLVDVLTQMDGELEENEILFAKVHPLAADRVDYSSFRNIRKFPAEYETYEFLNVADCLITDYSSVFYDFTVTGRKIVLYTYDEEEYLSTRGLYEPISSLPFVQVKTVAETLSEARSEREYDDSEFLKTYCSHEEADATKVLLRRVMLGEGCDSLIEKSMPANGKMNNMVYVDNLRPGRDRDALMTFLEEADKEENNWFITFNRADVTDDKEVLLNLPEGICYFGRAGKPYVTNDAEYDRALEKLRCFGNMRIDKTY